MVSPESGVSGYGKLVEGARDHRGEHTRDGSARRTEVKAGLARRPGEAEAERRKHQGHGWATARSVLQLITSGTREEQEARPTGG